MQDIQELSKAPTGKGRCFSCRKKITKGTPRVWFWDTMHREVNKVKDMHVKRLVCHRCCKDVLSIEIQIKKQELKKLVNMKRKFLRMMKGKLTMERIIKEKILEGLGD